jgi:Fe-S-cluster containining protein
MISSEDVDRWMQAGRVDLIDLIQFHGDQWVWIFTDPPRCKFLVDDENPTSCSIYPLRPIRCREYLCLEPNFLYKGESDGPDWKTKAYG